MKYLLDTHIWIWWNMNPQKLSTRIHSLLSASEQYDSLLLSAISPWEFSKLLEKKRIGISCNTEEWIAEALDMTKLRLIPLTPTIAYRSTSLPQPFNGDPADQIIVATAREENATILTKDKIIRNYEHVRSLW
ncbi:MAG: type II toxin-antitoxin system VapC family toxin [Candidatus Aegiribacteria sp.]|nr:type II toxin-antitoxin system VapC family toxin [Candidatus Aegiribacteria sp.]